MAIRNSTIQMIIDSISRELLVIVKKKVELYLSDGIGSKVKMRNAFRYLKLTAALALILNFGLFFNRLLRHFIFPNLPIWKQARDIWVFVEKLEDRRLCVSQLSRRDTGGTQRSVKITYNIWSIRENWNIPKNIFQIIAPKCFFSLKARLWIDVPNAFPWRECFHIWDGHVITQGCAKEEEVRDLDEKSFL